MDMEPFFIMDVQPGILCADERRYHVNASTLGVTFPFPPMLAYKGKMYIAASTISDREGGFTQITYKSDESSYFIVHNKRQAKKKGLLLC